MANTNTKSKTSTTKKSTTAKKTPAKKTTTSSKTTAKKTTTTAKKTATTRKTTTAAKKPAVKKVTTTKKTVAPKIEDEKIAEEVIRNKESIELDDLIDLKPIEEEPIKEEPVTIKYEKVENVTPIKIKKKMKRGPKLVLLALVIVALITCAVLLFCKLTKDKDSYKDKATYADAFFIRNKKGKYALFNDDGKKVTDFIFDNAGKFINKTTVVYKENDGYAIIDTEGKQVVKYGKYGYISNYEGLYKVRSDKGYSLINSDGKVILDEENLSVSSYGDDYPFVVVETDKNFIVYMYDGTKIYTFDKEEGIKDPTTNHIDEYATVFYNGENIIINLKEKELVKTFKNNQHFCANYVTEDKKILSLNACTSWYESLEKPGHMLLINEKNLVDITDECNNIIVYKNAIVCSKENGQYFLDVSKKDAKAGNKLSSRYAFVDDKTYMLRDDQEYKIMFYKKGKKIKTIEASIAATGLMNEKFYVLYVDNSYEFYNTDGKRAFEKSYKYATPFDTNSLAKVSNNGKDYYLINTKGKSVSNKYSNIINDNTFYRVTDNKGKYGVLNSKGKELIPTKYEAVSIKQTRDKYYAILTNNGKSEVYDLDKNKSILTSKDAITLTDHYIKTSGTKVTYYTYSAEKIFSE